ncbi:hypothetical protein DTO195F2_6041 [Paecilomyces variotii]|nr:hypothetical protein DTO195F2_6041 [Paecilomyces variotii]KAJ9374031.1 hypothetical protein DTO282E5_1387 [Paecilomyces variotii]
MATSLTPTPSLWSRALSSLPPKDQRIFQISSTSTPDAKGILQDILSALERQRDRCKRDVWTTISVGGKELVIRDLCAKIASYVKKFMEVVDVAVQYDPVHAALPWAGVRFLLQLSFSAFEAFGAIVEGLEKATELIARCSIIEALVLRHGGATDARMVLEKEMVKLYSIILGFLCKAKKHHDGSRMSRLTQKTDEFTGGVNDVLLERVLNLISTQSLQESVREMQVAEQKVFNLKGLVDSESKNINPGTNLAQFAESVLDMDDIQGKISTMLLAVSTATDGIDNIQPRLKGALLDLEQPLLRMSGQVSELHDALKENERDEILRWLSTVPVQQHYREACTSLLPDSGEWLLESPCFKSWRDSSSSETFWLNGIPGCGKTKLAKGASLRRPSVEVYQKRREEAIHIGEKPAALTVEETVDLICEHGRLTPFTIIIDALDECGSQQRGVILSALEEIRQRCRDVVKIFVSSRHEEDLAAYFSKGEVLEVTSQVNEKDLKRFVKKQVENFVRRWSTMHDETTVALQQLEKDITNVLVTGAQGMFLWVALQIENIGDSDRIKDIDGIRQALGSLPSALSTSYEAIHRRIQSMSESCRQVAVQCLQWLLYAGRKLSISELVAAVSRPFRSSPRVSPRSIVDYCCNLVVIDNEADTFRLAHLTVREFLETLDCYSIQDANAMMAERCLETYLADGWEDDDLLNYATQNWPAHVEQLSGSPQRAAIKTLLTRLFTEEEHFEDWLEILDERPIEEGPSWGNSLERKLEACFSSPPSALFTACCFGIIEVLECSSVIETVDVNQSNKHNTSGLYLAARWGHADVVRKLIGLGAAVNALGSQYGYALQAASFAGHEEIVKVLLDSGASLYPGDKGEYSSPLQAALANGHNNVAQILIDAGFRPVTQKQFDDALEIASFKGNVEIVERLLCDQATSFKPNIRPDPLQVALFGGRARQAKRLLQVCSDINEEKGYFGNAVAAAIASGKLTLLQAVVDAGANLDSRGRFGFPLRAAAIANNVDITRYLLEKGLDPNVKDKELGDALQAAASLGNVDIMLLLLAHNASVDGFGGHFGNTLQAASFNGHAQAVRLLIEHGATLHMKWGGVTGRYRDALQAAVYAGHQEIVELLLAAGADLNPYRTLRVVQCGLFSTRKRKALPGSRARSENFDIPTDLGPLEVAARQGNVTLVNILLDRGAHIDAEDGGTEDDVCAYTALEIAAFWGHIAVVETLLDHGADVNAVRQTLGTPLQAALEGGHINVAELLLSRGAEIDKHWTTYGSCLQICSERGDLETVRFLVDHNANIEDTGGVNGNALQVACDAGNIDIVQYLLDKGANVKAPGKNVGNALQAASAEGHIDIVKLLLHHGMGFDDADKETETSLSLAAGNGHQHLVTFMLQQGANVDGKSDFPTDDTLKESNPDDILSSDKMSFISVPLHLAAFSGQESIVSILLENGANVYLKGQLRTMECSSFCSRRSTPRSAVRRRDEFFAMRLYDFLEHPSTPLFAACYQGHVSIARRLFQHGPWGYIQDDFTFVLKTSITRGTLEVTTMLVEEGIRAGFKPDHFDSAFTFACSQGYADFVEHILKHFTVDNWPKSLLLAVEKRRNSVIEILLQNGADVNVRDHEGNHILGVAVEKRIGSIVKILLQNGADVNIDGQRGNHLLEVVISEIKKSRGTSHWIEVLRILLDTGVDNDLYGEIEDILPYIARRGTANLFQTLEHHGYNLFKDPSHCSTALISASRSFDVDRVRYVGTKYMPTEEDIKESILAAMGHHEVSIPTIEELLSLNVPLFFGDADNNQPLAIASEKGYEEVVSLLLLHARHSSDVLEYAVGRAVRCRQISCVRLILDSQNWEPGGRSALCARLSPHCFPSSSEDMVTYILGQGVSPDTRDPENGETLLYIAAKGHDFGGVKRLVSLGADVDLEGEFLLSCGADVNAVNERIGTPLIAVMAQDWTENCWASIGIYTLCPRSCHECCTKVLLEWGADIDAEGGEFGTALRAAEEIGNEKGIKILLEGEVIGDNSGNSLETCGW